MTVQVQIGGSVHEVHGEDQSHQPEVMIAMKVTDENVPNAVKTDLKFHQLHLGSFPAIDQEIPVLNFNQLGGRESAIGRQGAAGSQYGDVEAQTSVF